MRKILPLLALTLLLTWGLESAKAGSGGPDAFGYVWRDSDELNGPTYNWVDITTKTGVVTVSGLADDNSVGPFNIGWSFRYYWTDYTQVKVGSNGWVGFNNIGNIASCFPTIPTAGGSGDNFVAPYMSDLNFTSSFSNFPNPGRMYYWSNNVDTFIIQWENVPWWVNDNGGANPPDWAGDNTFQMILSGVDSSITFQYNTLSPSDWVDNTACAADMEIGMENITGNIGLEVFNETIPRNQFAVKFYYPTNILIQVRDATPAWNANTDNAGQFFLTGASVAMRTNIASVGNADLIDAIAIAGELVKLDLTTVVWSDNASLTGLTTGTDTTLTFSSQATLNDEGQYYYNVETTTANNGDINPSNNLNTVEVSAVSCIGDSIGLTYATLNPPDGAISWAGGGSNDGVGMFIESPVTPAVISSIELFILGDDADPQTPMLSGFKVIVYNDNNGQLGSPVDSVTVTAANTIEDNWNTVTFGTQPSFADGRFYVAWFQGGQGIAIGTESLGPISRRTFEILSGAWAPYRQGSSEDFLIKVNVDFNCALSNGDIKELPQYSLSTFPNPAGDLTTISYMIPNSDEVQLSLVDIFGKTITNKTFRNLNQGVYNYSLNTADLAAGVYFVNLIANGERMTKKLVIKH